MEDGGLNTAYGTAPATAAARATDAVFLGPSRAVRRSGARTTGTCHAHVPVLLTPPEIGRHQ